jgi:hypothetical protein
MEKVINMIVVIAPIALLIIIILGGIISQASGCRLRSFEDMLPTFGLQNRIVILG